MPYKIIDAGKGLAYVVTDSGKRMSKKPIPKAKAEAQLKALYANVPDAKKKKNRAASDAPSMTLTFKGNPDLLERLKKHLAHLQYVSHIGHSGEFSIFVDGDGDDSLDITGAELPKIEDAEIVSRNGVEHIKELSLDQITSTIRRAIDSKLNPAASMGQAIPAPDYTYVRDVYPTYAVIDKNGRTFRVDFSIGPDGKITVSDNPVEVEQIWIPLVDQGIKAAGSGNMAGLAKHLAKKYGSDPHFFTKVVNSPELSEYDQEARSAIAARAHKLVTGHWPQQDKKEVSATPDAAMAHGPGGLCSTPGMGKKPKWKRKPKKSISVIKQANGEYRWILLSSSSFKDRDGEIVSLQALTDDVERADREKDYGPLRWWHLSNPPVDIGRCDFNMMHGKILVESGTFYDQAVAKKVKEKADQLEVSLGFRHPLSEPDSSGVFHTIRRFERSLLPKGVASNLTTKLIVNGGTMATKEEKINELKELLGGDDALVTKVLSVAEQAEKEQLDLGTAHKEAEEEKAKKPPEEKPAEETPEEEATESADEEATEDEEDEEEDKEFDVIGNLPVEEFAAVLGDAFSQAVSPLIEQVKEMRGEITALKEAQPAKTSTKEAELQSENEKLKARIAELEEIPAAARGHIASQSQETVISDERAKELGAPAPDPKAEGFNQFMTEFVGIGK